MRWQKRGRVFVPDGSLPWMAHHACLPIAHAIGGGRLRIYFSPRDAAGRSLAAFIEVDAADPRRVLYVHERPLLGPGPPGAFDDSGAMPSCLVAEGGRLWLFYIGWNRGVDVPYRNAIGLAVSDDGGISFARACDGPILDRTPLEPYFCASPFALVEGGVWRLWYASATGFVDAGGRREPLYTVKYAESADALHWRRPNLTCIPAAPGEAIARPCVLRDGAGYRMWYCSRGSTGYRSDPAASYRIGYAESADGLHWRRLDHAVGIARSRRGWDSAMLAYPFVWAAGGRLHMLYNGNGFGASGFGYAVSAQDSCAGDPQAASAASTRRRSAAL